MKVTTPPCITCPVDDAKQCLVDRKVKPEYCPPWGCMCECHSLVVLTMPAVGSPRG